MTNEELSKIAAELAAACNECDAGRLPEEDFGRMLDRAFAGMPDRERIRVHLAIARLQGRDAAVMADDGEIISASSDLAESLLRQTMGKLS